MSPSILAATRLAMFAACLISCATSASVAAPHSAHLSLEGNWTAPFILTVESTPQTPALIVSEKDAGPIAAAQGAAMSDFFAKLLDPEVPALIPTLRGLPIVRGQRRTRLVVQPADGKAPYTAAARKELVPPRPGGPPPLDNPEDGDNDLRCLVGEGQPPLAQFVFENQLQIIRTRDAVVLHTEYGDEVRVVPLTDRHAPKVFWSRLGDSIGHWEGATLVIETVGMPDADRVRFAPMMIVSGDSKVIERLTPVSDHELLYQFTIIDPKVFTGPWLAEFSWFRTDKPMYEHACHEGNYALANVLAGARYEEKAAGAAAAH